MISTKPGLERHKLQPRLQLPIRTTIAPWHGSEIFGGTEFVAQSHRQYQGSLKAWSMQRPHSLANTLHRLGSFNGRFFRGQARVPHAEKSVCLTEHIRALG